MDAVVSYRAAVEKDIPGLLWLIQLNAEHHNGAHDVKIGKEDLLHDGFGDNNYFKVIVAELETPPIVTEDSTPSESPPPPSASMEKDECLIGYALYYFNYSTWVGRGLMLEDIYVRAAYRNKGYGKGLMRECAKMAVTKGCSRMVWSALNWNVLALKFYESLGAKHMKEYVTLHLEQPNLVALADSV